MSDRLLKEDGDGLLLESGDNLLRDFDNVRVDVVLLAAIVPFADVSPVLVDSVLMAVIVPAPATSADVIAVELVAPNTVEVAVTIPGNGESRTLHRGTSSGFAASPANQIGGSAPDPTYTFYDDTVASGVTYWWIIRAYLGGVFVDSAAVSLAIPVFVTPAKPTISIATIEGVPMITDEDVTGYSGPYSHPSGTAQYAAEFTVREAGVAIATVGTLAATLPADSWRTATLSDLAGTDLTIEVRHSALDSGTGVEIFGPPSDPLAFELVEVETDPDPEDPVEIPILSSSFRSEYPFGTFSVTIAVAAIAIELFPGAPCGSGYDRYPFYLKTRGGTQGVTTSRIVGGTAVVTFDFVQGGETLLLDVWFQYACRNPDTGSFTGPIRKTGTQLSVTVIPFAPDTPQIFEMCNVEAGQKIPSDSFEFSWWESVFELCFGASSPGLTNPADYDPEPELVVDLGLTKLYRVEFGGFWVIEGWNNETAAWVDLAEVPFGDRYFETTISGIRWLHRAYYTWEDEYEIEGWAEELDLSEIPNGYTQFRVRLDGRGVRTTRPCFMDRNDEVVRKAGAAMDVADFEIAGSDGEEDRWSNIADGIRRIGTANTGGHAALIEVGTPRAYEMILSGAWATRRNDGSTTAALKFLPELRSHWGAGGYLLQGEAGYNAIVARVQGRFGAQGRLYAQRQGHMAWLASWWSSGIRHGKGQAYRQVTRHGPNGSPTSFAQPGTPVEFIQWCRSASGYGGYPSFALAPIYTIRMRVELLATWPDGSHQVRVSMQTHGPDRDTAGGWDDVTIINGLTWPCSACGMYAMTGATPSSIVEFYSLAVLVEDYGDCAVYESTPSRCILEWTLFEADNETIRAQTTTDPFWPGESGEAKPYLLDPLQYGSPYGEQEVDFAAGTASIATINVRHIDPPTIAGDQDSGWLTALMSEIPGRRNRLRRYIDDNQGWVTIADGPGGFPKLLPSFAGFEHQIKDTREKERRLRAFDGDSPTVILPFGLLEGRWGVDDYGETALIEEAGYISALFFDDPEAYPTGGYFQVFEKPEGTPFYPPYNAAMGTAGEVQLFPFESFGYYPNVAVIWRLKGEGDGDWKYAGQQPGDSAEEDQRRVFAPGPGWPLFDVQEGVVLGEPITYVGHIWVTFEDIGDVPGPAGTEIEFYMLYVGPANEQFPFYLDELTAGELLKALYDGEYSPRDPVTGDIVPTGIRYDEDALLAMTTPVRLRITEPAKNIREWAEKNVYGPLGYAPALDSDGQISPVSQVIPTDEYDLLELVLIHNANTEPVPGHAPGDNVISVLSFKYQRAYLDPDNSTAIDNVVMRDVEYIYRADLPGGSVERHGEKGDPEFETVALVAIGDERGRATGEEVGAIAAEARRTNLFERRVNGTDLVVVPVIRDPLTGTDKLRAGQWVRANLSWIPNGETGRRSVDHLGQVLAIKDLNCSWREVTAELVRPWSEVFY